MFDLMPFGKKKSPHNTFNNLWSNVLDDITELTDVGFKTDIKETKDQFVIEAELPGMSKEDIDVELNQGYLTISATNNQVIERDEEDYIRKERRSGSYQRNFQLNNVAEEEITAEYDNGILKVTLPKEEPGKEKKQIIDIE